MRLGNITESDIRPNILALLVFLCGAANDISLQLIGQFYLSEFLVLVVATFGLLLWRGYEAYDARIFCAFLVAGGITLLGYVISDVYIGTNPAQYLRGWGRTILIITDCFAIMLLAMKGRQYLWWFVLGSGIGGVIYLYMTGVPFQAWKLGYGERVAMVFIALLTLMPRKLWAVTMLGYGLLNIALDYRSLGAGMVLAAAIVLAASTRDKTRILILSGAGVVMFAAILVVVSMTHDEYKAHRVDSNIGRTSAIIVSLRAIAQSPILGYGSWTVHEGFAKELRKEISEKRAQAGGDIDFSQLRSGSGFQSHSQIIQSWVEGGVLGAVFFLFYGYRLFHAVGWCALRRPLDAFSPLFSFTIVMGIWNLFMSPALGYSRMQIALAVGVIVVTVLEKRRPLDVPVTDAVVVDVPERRPRILKQARTSGA